MGGIVFISGQESEDIQTFSKKQKITTSQSKMESFQQFICLSVEIVAY